MRDLIPLSEAMAPARARYAELIDAAVRWCHERGEDADPDLFALLCGGSVGFGELDDPRSDTAPLVWTRTGVRALLWGRMPNFATFQQTTCPLEATPAVWAWLDFLDSTGRLDPRSDPLCELRKPLICYGGLGFDGRPRPLDDPSPIPCECYLPYRVSAEYLNDEIRAGRLVQDTLVWEPSDWPMDDAAPARVFPVDLCRASGDPDCVSQGGGVADPGVGSAATTTTPRGGTWAPRSRLEIHRTHPRVGRRWTSDGDTAGPPTGSMRRAGARRPGRGRRPGTRPAARPGAPGPGRAAGASGPEGTRAATGPEVVPEATPEA